MVTSFGEGCRGDEEAPSAEGVPGGMKLLTPSFDDPVPTCFTSTHDQIDSAVQGDMN